MIDFTFKEPDSFEGYTFKCLQKKPLHIVIRFGSEKRVYLSDYFESHDWDNVSGQYSRTLLRNTVASFSSVSLIVPAAAETSSRKVTICRGENIILSALCKLPRHDIDVGHFSPGGPSCFLPAAKVN